MTGLIILFIILFVIYEYCYQSVWLMFHFIKTVLTRIRFVVVDLFVDTVQYFEGLNRFTDYGYFIYGGDFGAGKTLNMVKHAKKLIDYYSKFYKVKVFSNITLRFVDYTKFEYFEQLEITPEPDEIFIYIIDEAGSILYSRNYAKTRLNEEDLVLALNQVRKDRKCVLMTSQRHKMLDASIRRVCNLWYDVQKRWRFSFITIYDGYDLEYLNEDLIKPIGHRVSYATNKERKLYKHMEKVVNLSKERLSFDNPDQQVNVSVMKKRKPRKRSI